jgi:RNA polymerase sigma-70 factor (ECF subfamily)
VTQVVVPISDCTDSTLVRRARAGSDEAFNVLVRRWERKIYSHLAHLTARPDDAFDLCQEVFVSAYTRLGQLRDPERFGPWLFQIAHNTAHSYFRRRHEAGPEPTDGIQFSGPSTVRLANGTVLERPETKLLVEKLLAALAFEQREAIILKVYGGFKFEQIAEIQDCPLSTVKTRVYGGLEQLKKLLEK